MTKNAQRRIVPALRVNQWLPGWNKIEFDPTEHRSKPSPFFYLFSLSAQELRSLSGISRRHAARGLARAADLGIQREHDAERSKEISRFVEYGFPWSTLSEARRKSDEFNDLRKPGWLPTAIVINILRKGDLRHGVKVADGDVVSLSEAGGGANVILPYVSWKNWKPTAVPPFEVIDGQHRLWAFDRESEAAGFEVPVVAFHGLDVSWQAYLFWTINIKPKRINSSLAFDLYPLLRAEDWLDRAGGHSVYRETRSQELTEVLWSHPESPWYDKINMLGERQNVWVSQSAWIKSLMATFVRPWEGRGRQIGGLFGSRLKDGGEVLRWNRTQQAAFLVYAWQTFCRTVHDTNKPWASNLRLVAKQNRTNPPKEDAAFFGTYSLIATDQGVRGFLHVLNDLYFLMAAKLKLDHWQLEKSAPASDADAVSMALRSLAKHPMSEFLEDVAGGVATFDWRAASTPGLSDNERRAKLVFRGSGGYKELRAQLLEHLQSRAGELGKTAQRLRGIA